MDEVIVFHPLAQDDILEIVTLMLQDVALRLRDYGIDMQVTAQAKELLAKEGFDDVYGARPLRRAIQKQIEDRLSEEM